MASTCSLAKGRVVAHHQGLAFDALKLLKTRAGFLALWSDAGGLWWRPLDAEGVPAGEPARLTEGCHGGMDAVQYGAENQVLVACSRPAGQGSQEGELLVHRVDAQGKLLSSVALGKTGRDGRGVALTVQPGEPKPMRVNVVFHEGSVGRHVVHRVTLEGDQVRRSEVISNARQVAGFPASFVDSGRHYALWSESELTTEPNKRTAIWIKAEAEPARRVVETHVVEASPTLSREGGDLLLAFRDQRARDKRSELYVARLNKTLGLHTTPVRVGRANGEGAPQLTRCGSLHAAVLPREYGGEHYVAVHELDGQLGNRGGGHQYYANTREFVMASAACGGNHGQETLTLLIGERANPAKPGVELMTLRFSCP